MNKPFLHSRHCAIGLIALIVATVFGGCKKNAQPQAEPETQKAMTLEVKNDSMIYGLACDGTSDSVIVMWPFEGDPVTYNTIDAKRNRMIIGQPSIGDWVGVMLNREDSTEATMVVNLDQLKGTWTYPVMPVMKDMEKMSKRAQRRMMANMPDSIRETFFVPREYGFTLKRGHQAQAVGRVMRTTTLEDDSPVTYPEVQNYVQWYMCNGKLLLVSQPHREPTAQGETKPMSLVVDTMTLVSMTQDSLVLRSSGGVRYGFHRKESTQAANAEATKAEQKKDSMRVKNKE